MKRFISIFLVILSLSFVLISCGNKSKYDKNYVYDGVSLVGKWQENPQNDEYYQVYEFTSDNKITLSAYSYGILMQQIDATYKVEGNNTLAVTWGQDDYVDRNNFSITKDGEIIITQVIASETSEMELVPYNLTWNTDNSKIVGTWASNDYSGEIVEFRSDYTLRVKGSGDTYTIDYATNGDVVAFGGEFIENFKEDVNVMTYEVEGEILTLTGKGENNASVVLTFTRV